MSNYQGEVKHATISAADDADLIAAVTSAHIVVLSYVVNNAQATGINFESNTTDITGIMRKAAKQDFVGEYNPAGHFKTAKGEKLAISLTTATTIGGHLTYQVVN